MSDSSCWDWLLMAAAKWQPAGRQMKAGGAANGSRRGGTWKPAGLQMEARGVTNASPWGGKWKPVGLHMAEAMSKGLGSGD